MLFLAGYKERSHECVSIGLRQLYRDLPEDTVESLETLRYLRLKANYELEELQEATAKHALKVAENFLETAEKICKKQEEV